MGDYRPLFASLSVILFLGLIMPYMLGFLVDPTYIEPSGIFGFYDDIITMDLSVDIVGLPAVQFNPYMWLPDSVRESLSDGLTYLGALPLAFQIFILIISILSIIYTLIKLLPTT